MSLGLLVAVLLAAAIVLVIQIIILGRLANIVALGARYGSLASEFEKLERTLRHEAQCSRDEARAASAEMRAEVSSTLAKANDSLVNTIGLLGQQQKTHLDTFAMSVTESVRGMTASNDTSLSAMKQRLDERLEALKADVAEKHETMRSEAIHNRKEHRDEITLALVGLKESITSSLDAFRSQLKEMGDSSNAKLENVRAVVDQRLQAIQDNNSRELEQMRLTVDEKLQGTLDRRLTESFQFVSQRLEQVHRGLGQMQSLATDVGDLKKVLANVKTRGGWGEVQLEALLEEMLSPEQFERNVRVMEGTQEAVEFAVKFPGRGGDNPVYLPLDAKFPLGDYHQLVDSLSAATPDGIEEASKAFERTVKNCAKDISEKYINPPITTDFAVMFLPVEGLYAEVVRKPALSEQLRRDYHVIVAGPTTLAAILCSFQMGFRTLAIEKRSSEVRSLLSAVKTEFGKFGGVLDKVRKKLEEASNHMDAVTTRTRVLQRKLKGVEALPESDAAVLLQIRGENVDTEGEDDVGATVAEDETDSPVVSPDNDSLS